MLAGHVAIAIYPGSFDPLTNGHLSIIQRGLTTFDRLIVAVLNNPRKQAMFTVEERKQLIREASPDPRVEVDAFQGLLVHYTRRKGVHLILRGLRAVSDFEYEFQMAGMNRNLHPEVETLFLTPAEKYLFMSSTIVREIARLGGDVGKFVPPAVVSRLKAKVELERAARSRGGS